MILFFQIGTPFLFCILNFQTNRNQLRAVQNLHCKCKILLVDSTPQLDDLLGTSRGHDIVVMVVADDVDWCSVSTQGDERLIDGRVTSLAVRQWPDVQTVVPRCGDDQFIVSSSETHLVKSDAGKKKSRRSEENLCNCATHFLFLRNVPDHRWLFKFHRQQPSSLTVELGAAGIGAWESMHATKLWK